MSSGSPSACPACGAPFAPEANVCAQCGTARPIALTQISSGETILEGNWLLGPELGHGGMGTVYAATDLSLDRMVAVKLLAQSLKSVPEVIVRFEREARMLARLEHPNLVPIYAVGRRDGVPFIVMKYLQGVTLLQYLVSRRRLPPLEVLAITRQLCAGLGFIHSQGIIHRDMKPANVMLSADGHVTILDLGVAHDTRQSLTRSGILIGTPRYMSPEQILHGSAKLDLRSDIYALGTVIYEMLTGSTVFDAESDFSVMRAHTELPPPPLHQRVPELPSALNDVVQKALAKKPEDRFASCAELQRALEDACGIAPALAQHISGPLALGPSTGGAIAGAQTPATHPLRPHVPPASPDTLDATYVPGIGDRSDESLARAAGLQRPRAARIAVLAGVAIVALAGGVYALQRSQGGGEAAPPVLIASAPAPAPAPQQPPPQPPVAPAPSAAAEPKPAEAPQPRPTRPRPPRPPPPAGPAEVRVVSLAGGSPTWAWLEVDGIRQANTTPTVLSLSPGSHTLRLSREGFTTVTRTVTVRPGEALRVQVELQR